MGKKCAGTQIAHAIAVHAKTAHLAPALMAFLVNLTNERRKTKMENIVEFNHNYTKLHNQKSGFLCFVNPFLIDKNFTAIPGFFTNILVIIAVCIRRPCRKP